MPDLKLLTGQHFDLHDEDQHLVFDIQSSEETLYLAA